MAMRGRRDSSGIQTGEGMERGGRWVFAFVCPLWLGIGSSRALSAGAGSAEGRHLDIG